MQLRKMTLMLAALGAMGMMLTACGGDGRESLTCSTDADCLENEICHPDAKVCAQTCPSGNGSDCPSSAKTCEAVSATNTTKICKCTPDTTFCASDERVSDASNLECSPTAKICVPKGTTPVETSCNPANQPDTCSYGNVCSSTTNKCEAAAVGTCSQATGAPTWDKTTAKAPVIVSAVAEKLTTTSTTTQCGDGGPAGRITITFYAPNKLTSHTAFTDLQNHVKGKLNASASFIGPSFSDRDPPANANQGSMVIGFCGPATATGAIYIADETGATSNVVCVSW
jgi:hypothetical protein